MKYRILRKNVSKWLRLARMYAIKADSCMQRNSVKAEYWDNLNLSAMKVFNVYLDWYCNHYTKKGE